MVTVHHLTIISGQEYRMPVRLVDVDGHAVPIADYDLYGAARRGSETTRMSVAVVDGSSCVAIIPPLEQASYTYDLYLRHRSTTAEVQLMAGNISVRGRVASMPPVTGGGEDVVAVISADMTEVTVTVTPIAVATPDAWDRLDRAGDLLAEAIETAGALVPDAQRIIQQEVEAGQSAIATAAADASRQAGTDIAGAGDREVARAADRIRAVSGEEADAIASAGDAARQAVAAAGSSATSEALAAIDAATTAGKDAIGSSINNGVNAIGQSVTAGTGTISDATASGKSSIDSYVAATQADLARKSQPNIWSGVNTFNGSTVFNSSPTLLGQDFVKMLYIMHLMDTLQGDAAAGWTDKYAGACAGSAYNSWWYGTDTGATYLGKSLAGNLVRTDASHQIVGKEMSINTTSTTEGRVMVLRTNKDSFWGSSNSRTGYCPGQAMHIHADVPWETIIDTAYTPNVSNIPTVLFTAADADQMRVDIFYKTIHRQILLPKVNNVTQRQYEQIFVLVWTPTRFFLWNMPSYPVSDWRCVARIDDVNMNYLYRTNILGWNATNAYNIETTICVNALMPLSTAGFGDWATPMIYIKP